MQKTSSFFKKLGILIILLAGFQETSQAQTYCTPTYNYPGYSCTYGYSRITRVDISGIDGSEINDTPPCSPDYKDRTAAVPALQLATGRTYYGSLSNEYVNTHYAIWIDYNDDGIFSSTEKVTTGDYPGIKYASQYLFAAPYYHTLFDISISVPQGTPTGTHRMRIRSSYTATTGAFPLDPCANTTGINNSTYYGGAADYLVNIVAGPACAPVFTTNALNQATCAGSNLNFSVATDIPCSLQWQMNDGTGWVDINGATIATLNVNAVTLTMSGYQYRCVATNGSCKSVSNYATIWVKSVDFSLQTQNRVIAETGSTTFSTALVTMTGAPLSTYQWQVNDGTGYVNISNGGNYSNATNGTLTVSNAQLSMDNYKYRCMVNNGTCAVAGNEATLSVKPTVKPQYAYTTTATNANAIPLGGGSFDNYRSQHLYLPGDFGNAAPAGLIKKMYFRSGSNVASTTFANFKLSAAVTNATTLTTTYLTGLTGAASDSAHVFPALVPDEWMAIDLQTPVYFDPAKSFVVELSSTSRLNGPGFTLRAGGVPVNPIYTGKTQTYGPNANATGTSAIRYSYQFGFDIEPCALTITNAPADLTVSTDITSCSASNVSLGNVAATANCGTVVITNDAPAVFPKGVTNVTWTFTDGYTTLTRSQTVTVVDNVAPVITCPSSITVTAASGECNATINYAAPTATDNCGTCSAPSTISGYTLMGHYGAHTYFKSNFGNSWEYFDSAAKAMGGHLATISNASENNFLNVNAAPGSVWIGLTDKANEGTWVWSNGEPVTYTYWATNEPNNLGDEDYAMITWQSSGDWNDGDGSITNWNIGAVIEFDCDQNALPLNLTRTAGLASGSAFPIGTTTIAYSATDGSNNTSSCSFTVTVLPSPNNNVNISVTPSNNTYTGGVPTTIYLGYGPQNATLSATATGGSGFTYSWSPATSLNCTNCQNPVFTPTTAGSYTYTVTATNSNGCSFTKSVTLCVLDVRAPNGNDKVYVCHNGNTISISSNAVSAHLNNHSGDKLGNCLQSCGSANKGSSSETISAILSEEIKVYPNPNNGYFTVELPQSVENAEVTVMDMTGKLIERKQVTGVKAQFSLNVAKGVYMIAVKTADQMNYSRVVIQ